jgi:hypothetical protein
VNNIEAVLEKEFPAWFKKHVYSLDNAPEDLKSLALGPDARVVVHPMCNVNGARFRSVDREKDMRTQNSGVMTRASVSDEQVQEHYGVMKEVLELRYPRNKHGDRSVFLFRCDWFDLGSKKTTEMKDDGYFKSINTSVLWYKTDPFILAHHAQTCFYLEDTKFGDPWKVVQTFRHRNVYDVPEKDDEGNEDAYQEDQGSEDPIVRQNEDEEDEDVDDHEDDMADRSDDVIFVDSQTVGQLAGKNGVNNDMDLSGDEQEDLEPVEDEFGRSISDDDSDMSV